MNPHPLKIALVRFWPPASAEQDPGFRREILRQSKYGMAGLGLLGVVSVVLFVGVRIISGETVAWTHLSSDAGIVLWDKIAIVAASAVCLALSGTRYGPPKGRLIVGILALVASIAVTVDDLRMDDLSFSPAYLALVVLCAVGTMPYRPGQILGLCVSIIALFLGFLAWQTSLRGFAWWSFDPTRALFLVIVTPICVVIAALVYGSRYEYYKSRKKAQRLKREIREKSRQLVNAEREKAHVLEESYRTLETLQTQLLHQEKMASLGRLTAGIAHEMKNPLNFVVNYASLSSDLVDELREYVSLNPRKLLSDVSELDSLVNDIQSNSLKINKHGLRAVSIVDNMLRHSGSQSGEMQAVDLNALVKESVNFAYHSLRAQNTGSDTVIDTSFDENVGLVEVISEEIGRVIVNILDNAFYALAQKADAGDESFEPTVSVTTRRLPGSVEIEIRDNGPGLSEADREKIFEPFFTTKPAGSGTGLGLSLCYEIVTEGHRGALEVESEKGRYTRFTISLPPTPNAQAS